MEALDIRLHLEPEPPRVTHQEHEIAVVKGKPRLYDGSALKKARSLFMGHLAAYRPDAPLEGPLHMKTVWFFRTPKRGKDGWKTTKPDTENLQKLLKDCLTRSGFWLDDAQVCHDEILKYQADESAWHGIVIRIETLD